MANNYEKFDEVMDELLTGKNGTTIVNFDAASLDKFSEHQDAFWDGLLQYLQNENEKTPFNNSYGIRQNMFPTNAESVIEYINDNADLIDSFLDRCLKSKTDSDFLPHWNEGFEKTLQIYRDYFVDHGDIIHNSMTVDDIINANAGNSFDKNGMWVRPWKNYNGDTYSDTRANDKIIRVLSDKKCLQFTHLFNKYIRLLMPEYQRVVEVEDLNRNFWVIGQVLTGILEFLFSEDSPINDLIDGMLDELAQLWENLLYLWVGFALISQELDKNDIQIVVIPVNNTLHPYVKFDNFDKLSHVGAGLSPDHLKKSSVEGAYWVNHLEYLKHIYNKSTLVIIPEVRENSYQENFYAKVYYPGAFVYNRQLPQGIAHLIDKNATDQSINNINNEKLSWFAFRFPNSETPIQASDYRPFIIDITNEERKFITETYTYERNPWGVYENTPYYNFSGNYKNTGVPNVPYVAAIRTIFSNPSITINDGVITALGINVTCIDVVKDLYNAETETVNPKMMTATFALSNIGSFNALIANPTFYDVNETPQVLKRKITKGWYRGEVVSWFYINEPTFKVTINKSWIDIKDSTPATVASIKVSGKDELGFEYEGTTITFSLTGHTDDDQTETITIPAYSGGGNLLTYTFKEQPLENNQWVCTSENTSLTFNSTNKVVNFFNKWAAIDFNGQVDIINKLYTSWGSSGVDSDGYGGQYSTLQAFMDALETATEKEKWQAWIDEEVSDMPENSARFYASHYVYRHGTDNTPGNYSSYLEISPYVTLVIKDQEGTHKYNFVYNIVDNSTMHSSIKYPFMSSVYSNISSEAAKSTEKLCQWDSTASPTTNPNIYINQPTNAIYSPGFVTKGNLAYGDATFRENDNPDGKRMGIRISFADSIPYLSNFLILGMDRACAGTDGTSDFIDGKLITTPTKVKDLYPYYYKCEISRGAREATEDDDGFGEITATVVFNNTKTGLTALEPAPGRTDNRYQWAAPENRPYSHTTVGNNGEEPGFTNWAQMGMGKVEQVFLNEIHPLLEVEEDE